MLVALVVVFIIGYFCIAMEHSIKIDKSATALLLGMLMWVLFIFGADSIPYVVEQAAQHGYDVSHGVQPQTSHQISHVRFSKVSHCCPQSPSHRSPIGNASLSNHC